MTRGIPKKGGVYLVIVIYARLCHNYIREQVINEICAALANMIRDEGLWLRALQERNNAAHSYNQNIALRIVEKAKDEFYEMFCGLKKEVETNWL